MIDAANRRAHLVAGSHRLPRLGIGVFAGAKGGARLQGEDVNGVVYGVSHLRNSIWRSSGQSRRAELLTLPCAAHPQVAPKGGKGSVQGAGRDQTERDDRTPARHRRTIHR